MDLTRGGYARVFSGLQLPIVLLIVAELEGGSAVHKVQGHVNTSTVK